jgi:hypothetical protein
MIETYLEMMLRELKEIDDDLAERYSNHINEFVFQKYTWEIVHSYAGNENEYHHCYITSDKKNTNYNEFVRPLRLKRKTDINGCGTKIFRKDETCFKYIIKIFIARSHKERKIFTKLVKKIISN